MIVAERKEMPDLEAMLEPYSKIAIVGCKGCVTVCSAGGRKEVDLLSAQIKLARREKGRDIEIKEITLERQCDPEYVATLKGQIDGAEAVLSMACGAGVQFVAEHYATIPILPALNTRFIGVAEASGEWGERCQACGACKLHLTGGVCPIARCSKSLLNGPCGGSMNGKCEINSNVPCGWQLIVDRLTALNMLDQYEKIAEINDWSTNRDGGPRHLTREDLK
ncbi:MAG: hypothetical protein C4523_16135 [Myxococcales bacterium]|nr:MAG: hypothetical protein C4523_16135 [Myxococcales bacterium]